MTRFLEERKKGGEGIREVSKGEREERISLLKWKRESFQKLSLSFLQKSENHAQGRVNIYRNAQAYLKDVHECMKAVRRVEGAP
ncbi:hypothetical protein ACLOJK_008032 [Asimina triloba]